LVKTLVDPVRLPGRDYTAALRATWDAARADAFSVIPHKCLSMRFMNSCSHVPARFASAGLVLLALAGISACGGGSKKSSTTATTKTKVKHTKPKPKAKPKVTEAVRLNKPGAKYGASVAGSVGDVVEFRTVIPAHGQGNTAQLKISNLAGRLSVNVTAHHQSATATVTSATHKPIVLSGIRYACDVPPTPSFCPLQHVSANHGGYQLQVPIRRKAPIIMTAKLATSTTPPARKLRPVSGAVVPLYTITEKAKAITPKSSATTKFAPSAVVKPGDVVDFETHVGGKISGAPQPVTITIPQGPASTLTITASVPGGAPSHATITAGGGGRIALVAPHFTCFLPPYPTFCPPSKVTLGHKAYTLVFGATPNRSPIIVVAKAQAA
jgi:hypothetical protein